MTNYLKDVYSLRATPQSEPIPGTGQVLNSAGGYAFPVDCWTRLERFLILGSEGGSYYARERQLTVENARAVAECMAQDYRGAIDTIVAISENGRAPSNDPAIFALARGLGAEEPQARRYAAQRLDRVCRISTHLFHLCDYVQQFRGWGRSLRRAVQQWYHKRGEDELVYQLAKYRQRDGWSHRDVLRKCHLPDNSAALRWAIGAGLEARTVARRSQAIAAEYEGTGALPRLIEGYQQAHRCQSGVELARVIRAYGLTHEMVPNHLKDQVEVWEALFERMPMTAMSRNVGMMSNIGLLKPLSPAAGQVCQRLSAEKIRQARIHPLAVLMAGRTYQQGHGLRGSLQWEVVPQIVKALEEAFYAAFVIIF